MTFLATGLAARGLKRRATATAPAVAKVDSGEVYGDLVTRSHRAARLLADLPGALPMSLLRLGGSRAMAVGQEQLDGRAAAVALRRGALPQAHAAGAAAGRRPGLPLGQPRGRLPQAGQAMRYPWRLAAKSPRALGYSVPTGRPRRMRRAVP